MREFFRGKIDLVIFISLLSILICIFFGVRDFSTYAIHTIILIGIFLAYRVNVKHGTFIFSGFLFLLLLHVLGCIIFLRGDILYNFAIIPGFFAYDNIVHATGAFFATVLSYSIIYPYLKFGASKIQKFYFFSLLVLVGLGIGAVIEIVELFAVLFFDSPDLTGWYIDNALDLVFDTLGAMFAALYLLYFKK